MDNRKQKIAMHPYLQAESLKLANFGLHPGLNVFAVRHLQQAVHKMNTSDKISNSVLDQQ